MNGRLLLAPAALVFALAACGGAHDDAGKRAAIQTMLDQNSPTAVVLSGRQCYEAGAQYDTHAHAYPHVKEVHVTPAGLGGDDLRGRRMKCLTFTWDTSVGVMMERRPFSSAIDAKVRTANYVVDKLGEEQAGVTPFRAHVVPTTVGNELVVEGFVKTPPDITDGQATLHKDADGKWVATR